MALRLIGLYDGKTYTAFSDVRSFLNYACRAEHSGRWYYAHAGGLYDLAFILEYLVDNPRAGVSIQCAFSGSAAIIVKITLGKHAWYFCDSYWLIRQPLRDIGVWVGEAKGGGGLCNKCKKENCTCMFYAPMAELTDYNEKDCRILYKAIRLFEQSVLAIGGQLQKTIASTALDVFKRRFLKEDIKTDPTLNEISRGAYCASRVEVFETKCEATNFYDINSSFPHAMTFEAPGNLARITRQAKDGELSISKARVTIPMMNVPPAPFRNPLDGRVYFPYGTWEAWFSNVDLELIEDTGGRIESISQAHVYEPFTALKDYAQTLYEVRKNSKSPAEKTTYKFLLNSLYGKFGEGCQKQKVLINPPKNFFSIPEREPGGLGRELLMPGVHALVESRDIPHAHVPISAHITAVARRSLYNYIRQTPIIYYCDTDSLAVPPDVFFPSSNELGKLKFEYLTYDAHFAAPKLYAFRKAGDDDYTVKGKGYSRVVGENGETHKLNYDDFKALLEHKDLHLEQFARLRGLWKSGDTTPRELDLRKTWRGTVRTKRRMLESGSEPWNVAEIKNGK